MTTTHTTPEPLQQEVASLSDNDLLVVKTDIELRLSNAEFASASVRKATVETATRYLEAVQAEITRRQK